MYSPLNNAKSFSVAPMLKWTTRHCRYFYRLLAPQAELYTEMVIAQAFVHGGVERYVRPQWEHPITLQLAGSDPKLLADAAYIAKKLGFDGINLNIGCPSERLQHLNAGAKAFLSPNLVGECIQKMKEQSSLPVSIKTRIGVDEHDTEDDLWNFLETTNTLSECTHYILHARKALLSGLNPAQNRTCPPLNYSTVYKAKEKYPLFKIILNGGLNSLEAAYDCMHEHQLDGVMMGRAIWNDPKILLHVGPKFFNQPIANSSEKIFQSLNHYLQEQQCLNPRWKQAFFPLLNLFKNTPWAKRWKNDCLALEKNSKKLEEFFNVYQKIFFNVENNILNKNKTCIR